MIGLILLTLFGFLLGYREVQILCERGSWKWKDYRKNLYWFTDHKSKLKDFDSFHVSNGLAVLICAGFCAFDFNLFNIPQISQPLNIIAQVIALWLYIFYIRNLALHIILKKQPEYKYIIPLIGKWIWKNQ